MITIPFAFRSENVNSSFGISVLLMEQKINED